MVDTENDYQHPEFVVFCIEVYKTDKGITGKESYNILKDTGAINFIGDCYEALHCMGSKPIVEDIDEYIKNHSL